MVGFIKGLFGGKKSEGNEIVESQKVVKPKEGNAFFLDADQAKTLGDIEYMRTAKTVKRTFPKTKGSGEEAASTRQISSMEAGAVVERMSPVMEQSAPKAEPVQPKEDASQERRRTDTSMDMFRNMARDIKNR